jgi:hypothetical protein
VSGVYELADLLRANGSAAVSKGFEGQPAVIKGADRLLSEILVWSGGHARTVIGGPQPDGPPVELVVSLGA